MVRWKSSAHASLPVANRMAANAQPLGYTEDDGGGATCIQVTPPSWVTKMGVRSVARKAVPTPVDTNVAGEPAAGSAPPPWDEARWDQDAPPSAETNSTLSDESPVQLLVHICHSSRPSEVAT